MQPSYYMGRQSAMTDASHDRVASDEYRLIAIGSGIQHGSVGIDG